jgi:hypothetical protein
MLGYLSKVREAVEATVLQSTSSFRWLGQQSHPLPKKALSTYSLSEIRGYLLDSLKLTLYSDFYCPGRAMPRRQGKILPRTPECGAFVDELSDANGGRGTSETGWSVRSIEADGTIVVQKKLSVWIPPQDAQRISCEHPASGASVLLPAMKESLRGAPGYYVAFGNAPFTKNALQQLTRLYFNLRTRGAARVVDLLTGELNRIDVPFQFKVLSNPNQYNRCDAGVLYISTDDFKVVAGVLADMYSKMVEWLKPGTPVFTKPLAHGLGLAEDPLDQESFGRTRCHLLAEGIIRAYERRASSIDDRVAVVCQAFDEAGISLTTPYLNPGSLDVYEFSAAETRTRRPTRDRFSPHDAMASVSSIAKQLCQGAIWNGDRCNWLGSQVQEESSVRTELRLTTRALGPELYGGSCGIGLFLGEAYRVTGDLALRRTARGAIQHALSRTDSIPHSHRIGLFTGLVGIALASARVGQCCEDENLLELARELALKAVQEPVGETEFDLLSGRAGAIVGLLALSLLLDCQPLTSFAIALGDELLRSVQHSERGASWPASGGVGGAPHLTGFSHGAAGAGYAMLELSHFIGGDARYQSLAEEAFRYERSWFDPVVENWPHFSTSLRARGQIDTAVAFDSHWCHGAAGIALSRLRAYRLLGNYQHMSEALSGLRTTRGTLHAWLTTDTGNFSLCHGFAGNAEVLRYASEVLPEALREDYKELSEEVANYGIATWARAGAHWPCGVGPEEHPGFMIGLAGIGHFYLRLCYPDVPSILMLQPEKFMVRTHATA